MKIIVAFVSSFIMFVMTWLVVAVPLAYWWPYSQRRIVFENIVTSIASLIGFIIGGIVATQTFRVSLKAKKSGKLYKEDEDKIESKETY